MSGKMESKTAKYEKELLEVIKDKKIAFLDHAFGYTTFSRSTAYEHNLDKSDTIKAAIGENRVKAKNYMLNKWIASENPTLQIAAMRLLSDSEEHRKLNQSYLDHSGQMEINQIKVVRERSDNKTENTTQ